MSARVSSPQILGSRRIKKNRQFSASPDFPRKWERQQYRDFQLSRFWEAFIYAVFQSHSFSVIIFGLSPFPPHGDFFKRNEKMYVHVQRELVDDVDEKGKSKGCVVLDHCKTPCGDRELLLNRKCRNIFQEILKMNREAGFPSANDDFVFLRKFQNEITFCTDRCFAPKLEKYCKKIGMTEMKSPHDARQTALTNMYKAGMPLTAVQKYAGHATLKQTLDYLKLQDDEDITAPLEKISEESSNIVDFHQRSTLVEHSGAALFM